MYLLLALVQFENSIRYLKLPLKDRCLLHNETINSVSWQSSVHPSSINDSLKSRWCLANFCKYGCKKKCTTTLLHFKQVLEQFSTTSLKLKSLKISTNTSAGKSWIVLPVIFLCFLAFCKPQAYQERKTDMFGMIDCNFSKPFLFFESVNQRNILYGRLKIGDWSNSYKRVCSSWFKRWKLHLKIIENWIFVSFSFHAVATIIALMIGSLPK